MTQPPEIWLDCPQCNGTGFDMVFVEDLETLASYSLLTCGYCEGQGEVLIVDYLEWPWWKAFPTAKPTFMPQWRLADDRSAAACKTNSTAVGSGMQVETLTEDRDAPTITVCPECRGTGWETAALFPPQQVRDQDLRKTAMWDLSDPVGCDLCGGKAHERGRGTITSTALVAWRKERVATGTARLHAPKGPSGP